MFRWHVTFGDSISSFNKRYISQHGQAKRWNYHVKKQSFFVANLLTNPFFSGPTPTFIQPKAKSDIVTALIYAIDETISTNEVYILYRESDVKNGFIPFIEIISALKKGEENGKWKMFHVKQGERDHDCIVGSSRQKCEAKHVWDLEIQTQTKVWPNISKIYNQL